jgi:hypothetical protein
MVVPVQWVFPRRCYFELAFVCFGLRLPYALRLPCSEQIVGELNAECVCTRAICNRPQIHTDAVHQMCGDFPGCNDRMVEFGMECCLLMTCLDAGKQRRTVLMSEWFINVGFGSVIRNGPNTHMLQRC